MTQSPTVGISLVMATLGRSDEVGRMIASLVGQTDRRFELIVVDQNGDDRLVPHISAGQKVGLDIRHICLDKRGLSLARNRGLVEARYPLVGFPDDDCWYEPDTVAEVLSGFSRVDAEGLLPSGLLAFWIERGHIGVGAGSDNQALQLAQWRGFRGQGGSSITLFLRRDCIATVGGFDEQLGVGAWFSAAEETDLILRVLATGERIVHCPSARVHHAFGLPRQDVSLLRLCHEARRRERGTGALYAKHSMSAWVVLRGIFAPPLRALLALDPRALLRGLYVSCGRIEGWFRWGR